MEKFLKKKIYKRIVIITEKGEREAVNTAMKQTRELEANPLIEP